MQLVALQMNASSAWPTNQATIAELLAQLPSQRPLLVLLPENAVVFGAREEVEPYAEALGEGPIQSQFSQWAQAYGIWLVVGSMPTRIAGQTHIHATSLVYNEQGQKVGHYHKLHLFDVEVADAHGRYRESDTFTGGDDLCLIDSPFGRLGLSICYDLRFPQLYSALRERGAEILLVPAAFTQVTGQAHWQPLLQARAIENQCYVIAAGLVGDTGARPTWGHSMIIDPWGEVKACLPDGPGLVVSELDSAHLSNIRRQMPVTQHARLNATWRNK